MTILKTLFSNRRSNSVKKSNGQLKIIKF